MRILTCFAFAVSIVFSAIAAGPGGNQPGGNQPGGNQPGGNQPGGNQPGGPGGGGGGSFTYDSVINVTTNANCLVREGTLYGLSSLSTSVAPLSSSDVSALADGVFAGNATITAVDLSSTTISELPADAFSGCTSLQRVVLPACCTAIGAGAFAGCSALCYLTAQGVTEIGEDAFRGCTSLTAMPPNAIEIGAYAFSNTALTEVGLDGVAFGEGAFSSCPALVSVSSLPAEIPDAAFAGCTALATADFSVVTAFGQSAFAGMPATELILGGDATIADYAFAADAATVAITISIPPPDGYKKIFLGREVSYTHNGDVVRAEASDLVAWMESNVASGNIVQPQDYATASLEAWLDDPSNAEAIFAYCYGEDAEIADALTVEGTSFTFTDTSRSAVAVTPVAAYALTDEFSEANVELEEIGDGVYAATSKDPAAKACFMRLEFSKNW